MRPPAEQARVVAERTQGVVERAQGVCGELALRRAGPRDEHFEIIADGVFLMATYNRRSEEMLAREAVAYWRQLQGATAGVTGVAGATPTAGAGVAAAASATSMARAAPASATCTMQATTGDGPRVLVGGLGVGYTVAAVLAAATAARCDVVELEPAVVDWHLRYLARYSGFPLDNPRVRLLVGDVGEHIRRAAEGTAGGPGAADRWTAPSGGEGPELGRGRDLYDLILLDTDNGPDWLISPSNSQLYSAEGLKATRAALKVPGVAAYWSASASPAFARRLAACFGHTRSQRVPRGMGPDPDPDRDPRGFGPGRLDPDAVYFGLKLT